jgi:hypothetical protein
VGRPPSVQDLPGLLVRAVVGCLAGRTAQEVVQQTSLEDLVEARDVLKALLRMLQTWAGPLAWLMGEQGAAFKLVSEMSSRLETQDLPGLLLAQLLLRPMLPAELVDALQAPIPTPPIVEELAIIQVVIQLVPGAADVWSPAALRALQRGGEAAKRRRARIDHFVTEHRDLVEKAVAEARLRASST